jgi:hypothetical protein
MTQQIDLYGFVLRGDVAQDAVKRQIGHASETGRIDRESVSEEEDRAQIASRLPFDLIERELVDAAKKMSLVYTLMAAFENAARKFISDRLLEEKGAEWWESCVSSEIKTKADKRKEEEEQHRYHGARGQSMINYCEIGDLANIINKNQEIFTDYIPSVEWARQIFRSVERSRNVIMHSGDLSINDIERVAMNIRDWVRQLGG